MPVRVIPVESVARRLLMFAPLGPQDWRPPPGIAALEFVNKPGVRAFSVLCAAHGRFRADFGDHDYARRLWMLAHPGCRLELAHLVSWPAAAAGVAARRVTATPDPSATDALGRVRAEGRRVEEFLATHGCVQCVPGLSSTVPLADPEGAIYALEHEARCPSLTKET